MSDAEQPAFLWHNHRLVRWEDATGHLTDNWWASVGAVFEGIRGYHNPAHAETYVFRLGDHLARLASSMRLMRMDERAFPPQELAEAIVQLVRENDVAGDVYIMPLAYTTGGRSFAGAGERVTNVFITSRPTSSMLGAEHSLTAGFSSWTRIGERTMPPRVKAIANYRNSQLASQEAVAHGYDTALLMTAEGKVTEGPGSCVFFARGGRLFTPDLTSGILESITRDCVIRIARELMGVEVEERIVDRTEAYLADEAFLCGTAAEITPLAAIDGYAPGDGAPGSITRRLRELYRAIVRGETDTFGEWRTPVGLNARTLSQAQGG